MTNESIFILYISARADRSGGPQHLFDLSRYMKKMEINISIASPKEEPFGPLFENESSHFIKIPVRRFSLIAAFKLLNFVKKHRITLVHSHGRGAGIYSRFLKVFGVPVIHTFHGIHLEQSFIGRIKYAIDKLISPLTNHFICVSYDEKETVLNRGLSTNDKISVVQNGIDVKRIDTEFKNANREVERKKFNLGPKTFVFGTLTRLTHVKGIDIFLQFAHEFYNEYPDANVKFLVAGDGENQKQYLELLESLNLTDKVIFVGKYSSPSQFLKMIDSYFSFSRWEGLPLSVLEAMSCSLPCILSDVTGHRELVSSNAGSLFSIEDPEQFVRTVATIIEHPQAAIELGANARSKVLKDYTVDQMATKTLELYRRIAKSLKK